LDRRHPAWIGDDRAPAEHDFAPTWCQHHGREGGDSVARTGAAPPDQGEFMSATRRAAARVQIEIAGSKVPLAVNWHPRARRFTLSLDPATGGARLSVPQDADLDAAIAFLRRHEGWLSRQRAKLAEPVAFRDGARIPLRGEPHLICHWRGCGRGIVRVGEGNEPVIRVAGPPDMLAIRLRRWLMAEARRDLSAAVARHAAHFSVRPARVVVRDQRTRWGSCSTNAALSFSWRLILAPSFVLDYVAAHEVAHILEMNHGPRFWKLLGAAEVEVSRSRNWLARHGQNLHRYGVAG
jgi:predicted metal-dependent hydrolase